MKKELTIAALLNEARQFCANTSGVYKPELYGITDGKAVGTFVEHLFQQHLKERYDLEIGNSASGLDIPSLNTDIKVTSYSKPQSSCPYRDSRQKIYGLGYNLLVMVYKKHDDSAKHMGMLEFVACTFIDKSRTADFQTTTGIHQILSNQGNRDDIFAFLADHNIPGDEVTLFQLAENIIANPPMIGYLTISNALQWRLQYSRVVSLADNVDGIETIIRLPK